MLFQIFEDQHDCPNKNQYGAPQNLNLVNQTLSSVFLMHHALWDIIVYPIYLVLNMNQAHE